MGTDNLFHKRKAKSYERKPGNKPTRQRLLIVCEGSKTEPHYFKEMRHELRLKTADVTVCGEECGSDPVSVFNYALQKFEEEDCKYDSVYCVIDTDEHKNLGEALKLVREKGAPFVPIVSSPCFEFWLILHHGPHTTSFRATSTKSIGDVVESALRKLDKIYQKGKSGVWARYRSKLDAAIQNSKAIHKVAKSTGNQNPSTEIHLVVEALMALKV